MKPWYQSKIVWLGVIQTLLGALDVVKDALSKGSDLTPLDFSLIASGVLTVIMRVWFTDTAIEK